MTRALEPLKSTLTTREAAEYLRMTVGQFRRARLRGEVPQPTFSTRPPLWARVQLDKVLEGEGQSDTPSAESDRLMERIHGLGSHAVR